MRKLLAISGRIKVVACLTIVSSIVIALNSCQKDAKKPTEALETVKRESARKGGVTTNSVPLYCEDLENPCTDPACQPYYNCEPEDGSLRTVGSEFAKYHLAGATFLAVVDSVGKRHNESQVFLLTKMQQKGITLFTDTIQQFLKSTTTTFFNNKGITRQNTSLPNFDASDTTWNISSYSSSATSILVSLKYLADNYHESQHTSFIQNCNALKGQALNLQNDQEALSVGIAVNIAINSFTYWKDNLVSWKNYLFELSGSTGTAARAVACEVNLKKLGGADIATGIRGAVGGGVGGGPAGVVAGGLLVPLAILILSVKYGYINSNSFILVFVTYFLAYRPFICGLRLIQNKKISKRDFWKNFIPFWNDKYWTFLFFNK